jgi:hypothetical protein
MIDPDSTGSLAQIEEKMKKFYVLKSWMFSEKGGASSAQKSWKSVRMCLRLFLPSLL